MKHVFFACAAICAAFVFHSTLSIAEVQKKPVKSAPSPKAAKSAKVSKAKPAAKPKAAVKPKTTAKSKTAAKPKAALKPKAAAKSKPRPVQGPKPAPAAEAPYHDAHGHRLQYRILFNRGLLRPQKEVYKYNEPADLINLVPILRDINEMIPRQFSLADHDVRLDPSRIVIQHEWMDSRIRNAEKNSVITLSYFSTGGYFGSRLDVPLFYSSQLGFSDWSRYPLGNYTMTFDRNSPFSPERAVYIRALTRF